MTSPRSSLFAVACALLLLLGAAATGSAASLTPVKIGTSGGMNTAIQPILYAKSAGLFEKNGLDVSLVELTDDTTSVQGLIAGEYDMLYTGAGTGIIAISKGADIRLVDAFTPWADYQFLAVKGVNSLKDMEGKVLGVSKIGSLSYLAPMFALKREGVDVSKTQFLAVGNDAVRGRALAAGTIQGAVLNGVNAVQTLQADPNLHVIYDVGSVFRESVVNTAFFARGQAIRTKPDVVAAAVKSLIEASRALMADEKLAVEQAKKSGLPASAVQGTYDLLFKAPIPYYGVDGGIDKAAVESTARLLKDSGDADKVLSFADIVDTQFVDKAMKELGPYKR